MSTNSNDLLIKALDNLKQRDKQFQTQQAEIQRLQSELSAKSSGIEKLPEALTAQQSTIESLKAELSEKKTKINQLESKLSESPTSDPKRLILKTAWGIDYASLKNLLSQLQWQAANLETAKKMLEVMGKPSNGYLSEKDIHQFPGEYFMTIDHLWIKYSQGRLGFSRQKNIFTSMGWISCAKS